MMKLPTWLPDALSRTVTKYANKLAVCLGGQGMTYAELGRKSDRVAIYLAERSKPGARVGILSDNNPEAVVILWSVLKAGAIVTYLNEQLKPEALGAIIEDSEPSVIFSSKRYVDSTLNYIGWVWKNSQVVVFDDERYEALVQAPVDGHLRRAGHGRDLAAIVYTSGSTGHAKGVCLSHDNLASVVSSEIEQIGISAADSYLMLVPLHFIHGLMELLVHNLAGATVHFSRGFLFPRTVVQEMAVTGVTGFSGVPYHFTALVERGGFLQVDLPKLRWMAVTGGKLPAERLREIARAKPNADVYILYGQTECAPRITALGPSKVHNKGDSVGSAPRGIEITIVDEDGAPLPAGEVGEVVVRGPNVMVGYWRQPNASVTVIDERGRLHTGDMGWIDEDGDLFLVGRKDRMIKSSGERIYPAEIEKVLTRHPQVKEAVVMGVSDPLYGQRAECHLVVWSWPDSEDAERELVDTIRRHCLENIPFARAPKVYHLWRNFPRKANGKPDLSNLPRP